MTELMIGLMELARDYISERKWPRWKKALGCMLAVPLALITSAVILGIAAMVVKAMRAAV